MNLAKELKNFKGEIKFGEPLSRHTTFRIGGKVKIWAKPFDYSSLRLLINLAKLSAMPILMVGAGSNLLVSDDSLEAIAINLSAGNFSKFRLNSNIVSAGAGLGLARLIECSLEAGLGGIEFLAGIPASLGGAIRTNAGTTIEGRIKSISEVLEELRIMTADTKIVTLEKKDLGFVYRDSNLSQCIILEAKLKLKRKSKVKIKKLLRENLKDRLETQGTDYACAGCIFKNPGVKLLGAKSAGFLIDKSGFKGKRVGAAEVSVRHANFIINRGGAKAKDVIKLISLIKGKVKEKFAITLESEIKIIDFKLVPCFSKGTLNFL